MIGIDTNVLVRVLVDDPGAVRQCEKARAFLLKQDKVFISTVVLVETVWVLQRAYAVRKNHIIKVLMELLQQKSMVFEVRRLIENSLVIYQAERIEFSDALILAAHDAKQCHLYTFDKKLASYTNASDLSRIKL